MRRCGLRRSLFTQCCSAKPTAWAAVAAGVQRDAPSSRREQRPGMAAPAEHGQGRPREKGSRALGLLCSSEGQSCHRSAAAQRNGEHRAHRPRRDVAVVMFALRINVVCTAKLWTELSASRAKGARAATGRSRAGMKQSAEIAGKLCRPPQCHTSLSQAG